MTDSERIQEIIKVKNLSNIQFCNRTGINPASLSHIMSGRSNPTLSILRSVVSGFPDLNPEWVLMGSGSMMRKDQTVSSDSHEGDASGVSLPGVISESGASQSSTSISSNQSRSANRMDLAADRPASPTVSQTSAVAGASTEEVVRETIAQMQKRPKRKVVEIRVFYDDGTYESFSGNR